MKDKASSVPPPRRRGRTRLWIADHLIQPVPEGFPEAGSTGLPDDWLRYEQRFERLANRSEKKSA